MPRPLPSRCLWPDRRPQTLLDVVAAATGPVTDGALAVGTRPAEATPGTPALRSPVQAWLERLHESLRDDDSGAVADYIPELGTADPAAFGIAVATVDGALYEVGDSRRPFTIQSISKPLAYALALEDLGEAAVRRTVGVEPTGEAFNAIRLSAEDGRPLNPMVNAGAIAVAGLIRPAGDRPAFERVQEAFGEWAGRPLDVDEAVFRSEAETGHRNRAIANLLRATGALDDDPDEAVTRYFRQCSVLVDARDLARIGATLAASGRQPFTGRRVARPETVRAVLSVMATCGMYDGAGRWLFEVGLPAKSGVAGGILAVLPGRLAIAVHSPPLDAQGNSVRGIAACRLFSHTFGLHLVEERRPGGDPIRARYDLTQRRSMRRRPQLEVDRLADAGARARVIELQGSIDFAAAEAVLRRACSPMSPWELLVLDTRRVEAVGRGVPDLFAELAAAATSRGAVIVVAGSAPLVPPGSHAVHAKDLDAAIEWTEGRLLASDPHPGGAPGSIDLREHELLAGLAEADLSAVERVLETRTWAAGELVVRRGDPADSLFLVVEGELEVSIAVATGEHRRLATVPAGTVLGELAFLGSERRTADVRAVTAARAFVLSRSALDVLGAADPGLRATLLERLLRFVARIARRMTDEVALLAG